MDKKKQKSLVASRMQRVVARKKGKKPAADLSPDKSSSLFHLHRTITRSEGASKARIQAKRMGLTYFGFGRYGTSKDGKGHTVTHVVKNGNLLPVDNSKEWDRYGKEKERYDIKMRGKRPIDSKTGRPKPVERPIKPKESLWDVDKNLGDIHNDPESFVGYGTDALANHYKTGQKGLRHVASLANYRKFVNSQKEKIKHEDDSLLKGMARVFGDYQEDGYALINGYLYKGGKSNKTNKVHPYVEKSIALMDHAFNRDFADVESPITVYTGTRKLPGIQKGATINFKGFLSTSIDPQSTMNFANADSDNNSKAGDFLEIKLAKGDKAINIDAIRQLQDRYSIDFEEEKELLLPRNIMFKVIDGPITLPSGGRMWQVSVDSHPDHEGEEETDLTKTAVKQSTISKAQAAIQRIKNNKYPKGKG